MLTETVVRIHIGDSQLRVEVVEAALDVRAGLAAVAAYLASDPPLPEELTNAVGHVVDHLDDVVLSRPDSLHADRYELHGMFARDLADVEAGRRTSGLTEITRGDAEELFRTLVTEATAERAANPGLQANAVEPIVAACCVLVGVMRRFHVDTIVVIDEP
jgi:exopolyphosphatase / guanosine-5'-triphosphate,3'-diphosphate pyrophosphatase